MWSARRSDLSSWLAAKSAMSVVKNDTPLIASALVSCHPTAADDRPASRGKLSAYVPDNRGPLSGSRITVDLFLLILKNETVIPPFAASAQPPTKADNGRSISL